MYQDIIDFGELVKELRAWGVEAEIVYDKDEEGYVIQAGQELEDGNREFTISYGFMKEVDGEERICAYVDRIFFEVNVDDKLHTSNRTYLKAFSRLGWFMQNRTTKVFTGSFSA